MKTVIAIVLSIASLQAFAQETAKVFIARKKIYTGTGGPLKVFVDDNLVCRINNNKYSVHDIPAGTHRFSVQYYSKESKDGKFQDFGAIEINVEAGKEYYIKSSLQTKKMLTHVILEEITANSWGKVKDGLDQDDCL